MSSDEVVELVIMLEDEVNNGGFHQFFNNSSGDNSAEVITALETIGALKMADITRRAVARFPENKVPKDRDKRMDLLWEHFPTTHEFDALNTEFFAYPDDLSALLEKYRNRLDNN
jgi:hypothetical protein